MSDDGIRSFQDLKETYSISPKTYYLYLQIRSALNSNLDKDHRLIPHPVIYLIRRVQALNKGHVSVMYSSLLEQTQPPLTVTTVWNTDCPEPSINWDNVWRNVQRTSQNLNNKLVNINIIYRTYLTPKRRYEMKIATSPNCTLCSLNQTGTFLHVMWECPTVHAFWREVAGSLSELFQLEINSTPQSMLLGEICKCD